MHSFYSIDYILRLPIKNVTRLLIKAKETKEEDMAWDVYLTIYPNMNEETYISFDDFFKRKLPKKEEVKSKTETEILTDVKEILNSFNNGGENY